MLVSDFDFDLPEALIAQQPPQRRGASRMLQLDRRSGAWRDEEFESLPELLDRGDLLVLNDSRVLPARLFATRAGLHRQFGSPAPEGLVEVLLTEPVESEAVVWRALVKPAKKVPVGEELFFAATPGGDALLRAEVISAGEFGERTLRFRGESQGSNGSNAVATFQGVLEQIGHLPLPPYIRRSRESPNTPEDRERYQTVYSKPFQAGSNELDRGDGDDAQKAAPGDSWLKHEGQRAPGGVAGSAAAPTAGLHFTPEVLRRLERRGVEVARLTLHVGLGTFQPVRVERTEEIRLHAEPYTLSGETAEALNEAWAQGRRIVAVGTTTTRTLEHVARHFEAEHGALSATNPLRLEAHTGSTGLFLSPGPEGDDRFKLVGGLLTNFHLPQSTLLMLVSALAGRERVLAAYRHAVAAGYRFFSYGDCMLVL